jgi:hypothetical protein
MVCADVAIYAQDTVELNTDTVIGKLIKSKYNAGYELKKDFLTNNENNPLRLDWHFENFSKVNKCTFGSAGLSGCIINASTFEPIKNASIKIYDSNNNLVKTLYSKADGTFNYSNCNKGTYKIEFRATGFKLYEETVELVDGTTTYLQTSLMVSRADEGNIGTLNGNFINAVNGNKLGKVSYSIYKGWSSSSSNDLVYEGSTTNGTYSLDIAVGNYTIVAESEGFYSTSENVAVTAYSSTNTDITLSPNVGLDNSTSMRIVLTWGEYPRDLDSHLYDGQGLHTAYYNMNYYRGSDLVASLDVDDTTSYGPETTTLYISETGKTYSFYVHDFTNKTNMSSNAMSNSGAKVQVYLANGVSYTYYIPTNIIGTVWHVFDWSPSSGITSVNEISNTLPNEETIEDGLQDEILDDIENVEIEENSDETETETEENSDETETETEENSEEEETEEKIEEVGENEM